MKTALTIAGSDSGGGAGIQADLKTFSALGVYGTSALTAVTAQNTLGVTRIHELPPEMVGAQIDAVLGDMGADAVKTGMLSSPEIVGVVAERLAHHRVETLVVDPVMMAKSGDALLRPEARQALVERLLPLALVVTPNGPEAEELTGLSVRTVEGQREAAAALHALGPRHVVVKGGHIDGKRSVDVHFDGRDYHELDAPRIASRNTHGTGCTFAAAVAACLACGLAVTEAVALAKTYLTEAIRLAEDLGAGHGPVGFFRAARAEAVRGRLRPWEQGS